MGKLGRVEQLKKEERLIGYRAQGMTDTQIMTLEGYSSQQACNRAVLKALRKHAVPTPESVRVDADITGGFLRRQLSQIIAAPPIVHSAIGRPVLDLRTCDCGNRLDPKPEAHAKNCAVTFVVDESVRVRAISELRKISSDRVDLHGAAKPREISEDQAMQQVRAWLSRLPAYRADVITVDAIEAGADPTDGTSP